MDIIESKFVNKHTICPWQSGVPCYTFAHMFQGYFIGTGTIGGLTQKDIGKSVSRLIHNTISNIIRQSIRNEIVI